jgi:hypothetical protein
MMKKKLFKILLPLLVFGILAACSKLVDELPTALEVTTHNPEILDTSSMGFHSNLVLNAPNSMFDCVMQWIGRAELRVLAVIQWIVIQVLMYMLKV